MNFQLSICGMSNIVIAFKDIWASLPVSDFIAFVVHRIRNELPRGSTDLHCFDRYLTRSVLFITADGSYRRLLCGPPPGLSNQEQSDPAKRAPTFRTCGEAFDLLDDGTKDGLLGFLYFAYNEQRIKCHIKYRDDIGGFRGQHHLTTSTDKHRQLDLKGIDLMFGDVLDLKKALVSRGAFRAVEDVAVVLEKSRLPSDIAPHYCSAITSSSSVELPDDELLFSFLKDSGEVELMVVEREGITVTVQYGGKRLLLSRFLSAKGSVQHVLVRLEQGFHIATEALFLEGSEHEGALQPVELLRHLLSEDGEVHLTAQLPPPPPPPIVNEGSKTVRISAASSLHPRASPAAGLSSAPTLHSAHVVPTERSHLNASAAIREHNLAYEAFAPSDPYHRSLTRPKMHSDDPRRFANSNMTCTEIAAAVHSPGGVFVKEQPDPTAAAPRVVCKIDIGDVCRSHASFAGEAGNLVDVVLPDDGLPFTGRDLKQFLVSNHIISSSYASPADIRILHGANKEVRDADDVTALVCLAPHEQMQQATILLRALRNQ